MQCSTILFINIVFIMVRATESKLIGKYEELFYLYLSLQHPWKTVRNCFYFHNGDNCDRSYWGDYQMLLYLCGLNPLIEIGFLDCYHHRYCCHVSHYWYYLYWYYILTESSFAPIQFAFVAFAVKFESTFGWTGWLHSTFV